MAKKVISLDSARERVEEKYASVFIPVGNTEAEMVSPVRLPKEKRAKLADMQDALREDDADQVAVLEDIFRLVTKTKGQADSLLKAIDGDLALLIEVFTEYSEASQVGEASPSQD